MMQHCHLSPWCRVPVSFYIFGTRQITTTKPAVCYRISAKRPFNQAIVESRHDWHVLYNYAKHLYNDRSELTDTKCATLLLSFHQLVLEQSFLRGHSSCITSSFEWKHSTASVAPIDRRDATSSILIETPCLVRYLRYMARLKPYHRLQRSRQGAVSADSCQVSRDHIATPKQTDVYAKAFAGLLMDSPDKFLAHEKNTSHIGPLRLSSDTLIVYPKAFTDPLYIDLTQVQGTNADIDECKCTSNAILEPRKLVDTCVRELLDRLLLIFKDNCSVSNQCTAAMFVAMMLYGPKLEARRDSSVDLAFRRLHQGLSHSVTTGEHTTQLSFRSLAYLLNSCLYPADLKPLCDFAARRIADSQEPVSLEWLENICFACSKIYYTNDSFYEAVAHQVVAQANTGSPAACLNLLWSFSRVGKANLVDTVLVHRIGEFSAETFAGCSLQFRRRAADALRQYFPEGTWKTIAGH